MLSFSGKVRYQQGDKSSWRHTHRKSGRASPRSAHLSADFLPQCSTHWHKGSKGEDVQASTSRGRRVESCVESCECVHPPPTRQRTAYLGALWSCHRQTAWSLSEYLREKGQPPPPKARILGAYEDSRETPKRASSSSKTDHTAT